MDHYVFPRQTRGRAKRTLVIQGIEEWDPTVGLVNTCSATLDHRTLGVAGVASPLSLMGSLLFHQWVPPQWKTMKEHQHSAGQARIIPASHVAWDLGAAD